MKLKSVQGAGLPRNHYCRSHRILFRVVLFRVAGHAKHIAIKWVIGKEPLQRLDELGRCERRRNDRVKSPSKIGCAGRVRLSYQSSEVDLRE